ncbi:unnamed protein product, partial [Effrenium voratum]
VEVDAMLLEDVMSQLPNLRAELLDASVSAQLGALSRLRRLWAEESLPLRIFGDLPNVLVSQAARETTQFEVRAQALACLGDLAQSLDRAVAVAESGALPLCVQLLQSSDEDVRTEAFRVLQNVRQQGDIF